MSLTAALTVLAAPLAAAALGALSWCTGIGGVALVAAWMLILSPRIAVALTTEHTYRITGNLLLVFAALMFTADLFGLQALVLPALAAAAAVVTAIAYAGARPGRRLTDHTLAKSIR